jgi:hypothetical protein
MKKFLVLLAPALVVVAFAALPAGALALGTGHYAKNNVNQPANEVTQSISWGTLTLESSAGNISCHNAAAANNSNVPEAHTETVAFVTWECKPLSGECAEEGLNEQAQALDFPWVANPREGPLAEEFHGAFEKIEVNILCFKTAGETPPIGQLLFKTGAVPSEPTEIGTSEPLLKNGTSGSRPSEVVTTGEAGHLKAAQEATNPLRVRYIGQIAKGSTTLLPPVVPGTNFKCKPEAPPLKFTCPEVTGTLVEEFPPPASAGEGLLIKGGTTCTLPIGSKPTGPFCQTIAAGSTETELKLSVASAASNTELGLPSGFPVHFQTPGAVTVKLPITGTTKGSLKSEFYSTAVPIPLTSLNP